MHRAPLIRMKNALVCLSLLFCSSLVAQTTFQTPDFQLTLDARAQVTALVDTKNNVNYVPQGQPGHLVRVRTTAKQELAPGAMKVQKNTLVLSFDGGVELQVRVQEKASHLRFELVKVKNGSQIDAVLWGPFNNTIQDTIGEVIGLTRNPTFALGLQALNPKTTGGKLVNDDGSSPSFAGITGTTAAPESFGSSLQAFCMNAAITRQVQYQQCKSCTVPPLPGYTLEGSAIALFGVPTARALRTMEQISLSEGLPHQMIGNDWIRVSRFKNRPYLITGFNEENFDQMLGLAKRLGFYSIYHEHPFENWGHFDLIKSQFPNGRAGLKACVEKARAANIIVGVHTLTNFITTNDPFVTTELNSGLQDLGGSVLSENLEATATEIPVDDPAPFDLNTTLNAVLIGHEIIRYQDVSREKPYRLLNCIRGEYKTPALAYTKGTPVRRLADHGYNTFFPGWAMQEQMIRNLAGFFNETGVSHLDFDGHEGALATGYGDYGTNYYVDAFLKQVDHPVFTGSSIMNHFYWHNNSYINWGEPWYASFRESQADHRFRLQPFFERNYMPNMLGWFLVTPTTSAEDVEWMMSVSAGYKAGYALVLRQDAYEKNPEIDRIIETIALWEQAKNRGVFTAEQRAQMRDTKNDFHLERLPDSTWRLQYYDKFRFERQLGARQPGEPDFYVWNFKNNAAEQPMHLQLMVSGEGAVLENLTLELNRYTMIDIPVTLKSGQSLVWDGSKQVKCYNDQGKLLETIQLETSPTSLRTGNHNLVVTAEKVSGDRPVVKGVVKLKGREEVIRD